MPSISTLGLLAVLTAVAAAVPATAQTTDASSLRQRLEDRRTDSRREAGERSLERTNSELEQRRRVLIRERNTNAGNRRTIPIMPKGERSSVVAN